MNVTSRPPPVREVGEWCGILLLSNVGKKNLLCLQPLIIFKFEITFYITVFKTHLISHKK
jgi:hypothetical protein